MLLYATYSEGIKNSTNKGNSICYEIKFWVAFKHLGESKLNEVVLTYILHSVCLNIAMEIFTWFWMKQPKTWPCFLVLENNGTYYNVWCLKFFINKLYNWAL